MNSTAIRPHGPSRGGISKRSSGGRLRVDKDGDLDMDGHVGGRGGRNGRGGGRSGGNGQRRGPQTTSGSGRGSSALNQQISKTVPRKDPVATRSRTGAFKDLGSRIASSAADTLIEVRIYGWRESKGTAEECVAFLERKSRMKLRKASKHGDAIIVQVPLSKVNSLLEWDTAHFASAKLRINAPSLKNITIPDRSEALIARANPSNKDTADTIVTLEQVLVGRYNSETKFLDLSKLGEDELLKRNGFFELSSTTSKMFPALMQVAEKKFATAQQKRDTVHSVSLAYNSLKDIRAVSTLSITFPDLKNLSLEGNLIQEWKPLDNWKNRFRNLEQLVLTGNLITSLPGYAEEACRRYPKLYMLDNVYVDPVIRQKINNEIATPPIVGTDANGRPILPLKVKGKFIHDDQGIAMQFLSTFFGTYEQNRSGLLQQFYGRDSTFSISVNTSAPRSEEQQNVRQYWDGYIPKSRNLKRVTHLRGRIDRLAIGIDEIGRLWNELPAIRYNLANEKLWSFDVWPIEITTGVMGIICVVHAEYEELNMVDKEEKVVKRSFDRTFTLHPDAQGEVKVGNDALVVRAYGGCESWKEENTPETAEENKQKMCGEIMKQTGLRLDWAKLCLEETGWEMDKAWQAFLEAKAAGNIPADAYELGMAAAAGPAL